ncbi:MAG: peptide deformylase [Cypionkella sp.]
MMREILRWPDARLSTVAARASVDDATLSLAKDMLETMYAANGRGLAAPQVGELTRVFVMDAAWKSGSAAPETFINPEILWRSDVIVPSTEGCLSIPGVLADVQRAKDIILRWVMADGSIQAQRLTGFRAICAQHEIDHLDGIVTLDHLSPEARAQAEAVLA